MESQKARDRIQNFFEEDMECLLTLEGSPRTGYLFNMKPYKIQDEHRNELACLLLYLIDQSGNTFKTIVKFEPYFYIFVDEKLRIEVSQTLSKQFANMISSFEILDKVDLQQPNHLAGLTNSYIKLSFKNVNDLVYVRNRIKDRIKGNGKGDILDAIKDMREYDVIYYTRVAIDLGIRCGLWYEVLFRTANVELTKLDKIDNPGLSVLAFDIETTKQPLKFPDREKDYVMMISYMIDGQGFLIVNREIVSEDILDFEYTPKPEFEGVFTVFNEADEKSLLIKFFEHIKDTKPLVFVTFNGDMFDWPFVEERAARHGINMEKEIGVYKEQDEYKGRMSVHMDCFYWVKRDAYLPQGSHGLKKVTKAKLGYDPVELDPEDMLPFAYSHPEELAAYSVSDAVATYYLYKSMIHDFIFALCTIIPCYPDDVLRKGSGTLCENLLMAQAFSRNIIFPNKTVENHEKFYNGNLIESETYIGGHVECLRIGVYRNDLPVKFSLEPEAYEKLIDELPTAIEFCAEIENKINEPVENLTEVATEVEKALTELMNNPNEERLPLIYHLDVGAMYPNIILTNRLQPTAVVDKKTCSACTFNTKENNCKRKLKWEWRGDLYSIKKAEYESVKSQLANEFFEGKPFSELDAETQTAKINERVKQYCKRAYQSLHFTRQELKKDTVCMRENSFYVDTVRDFRDRRNEYKALVKKEFFSMKNASSVIQSKEAEDRMNLYESLQLAHKIILNSFYGYVMRKGARWYSMEMAGMVTHMGGNIIRESRQLVERIGIPLELDTDGIWCLLPSGFPENFELKTESRTLFMSYPCTMLNLLIFDEFKNEQYQQVREHSLLYDTRTEMTIFFEIDGPYKAMFIPGSTAENKLPKKRYAVFNKAGAISELKGFELKRRGELKLIKVFEEEIFLRFLDGNSLTEAYASAAEVANRFWDILEYEGSGIMAEELIELVCENRVLSRPLNDYGNQKSTSITTAKRLADMLGEEIIKDPGLNCKMLISRKPDGHPVTERAFPVSVLYLEETEKLRFLRTWLKDSSLSDTSIKNLIDWKYYKDRLGGSFEKIISIPAALQRIENPLPRVPVPDWLTKKVRELNSNFKQLTLNFKLAPKGIDIEDTYLEVKPKETIPELVDMQNSPFFDDFQPWLEFQEKAWRQRRLENTALRKFTRQINKPFINIEFQNKNSSLLYTNWQVIGVYPVEPGKFKLWIYTSFNTLHSIMLEVKRKVYINSYTIRYNPDFVPVKMTLPHKKQSFHLYQYEVPEIQFQEKVRFLKNALADPNIEGVYELKIPLEISVLIKLGCVIRPNRQRLQKIFEQTADLESHLFTLEDFDLQIDPRYLVNISEFTQFHLYHIQAGFKSVWMLFAPHINQVQVYIVVPGHSDKPQMQKLVQSVLSSEWTCITEYPRNNSIVIKEINKFLILHKELNNLVILTSSFSLEKLQQDGLDCLVKEFPVIPRFGSFDLKSLNWQRDGILQLCQHFYKSFEDLEERLGFARYSSVPVANLRKDCILFLCDILFARSLRSSRHILWWSDEEYPDTGGEDDFSRFIQQKDFFSYEKNSPGLYFSISFEICLGFIPTCAIISYKQPYASDTIEDNPDDEGVVCLEAFKRVRSMVSLWINDASVHNSREADLLVVHTYRWLASNKSGMYDPLLHLIVHKLINELFCHLINELEQLGAEVVFARSNQLLISTEKYILSEAENFYTFMIKSIKDSSSFKYLQLDVTRVWQILIFKDHFNFGGECIDSQDPERKFTFQWNVLEQLPVEVFNFATIRLAETIEEINLFLLTSMGIQNIRELVLERLKEYMLDRMSMRLMDELSNLKQMEADFRFRPGCRFLTSNPALECVKILLHLFSLEEGISEEIELIRKNLLRLLGYTDFSPAAEYTEPCQGLIIPEVICENCMYTRDIDICRDVKISNNDWACDNCSAPISKRKMEKTLVFWIQKSLSEYLQEDLKCKKCNMNKGFLMEKACACSGVFVPTRSPRDFGDFILTAEEVAEYYEFEYLQDLLSPIVSS